MYHQLATRFGRNAHQISGREALDNEALYRHVPSIFAREAHGSRSERYVYVPTIDIVEGLRREGWFPFFAVQSVPRDGSRHGHAKHMLRLRRDDGIGEVRGAEALDLIKAWGTGHPGGVGTIHAGTSLGALRRMEQLIQEAVVTVPRALIAETIDLIAVLVRDAHGRRLTELARVSGLDPATGDYRLTPLSTTQPGDLP
jgi:hypothetical protein